MACPFVETKLTLPIGGLSVDLREATYTLPDAATFVKSNFHAPVVSWTTWTEDKVHNIAREGFKIEFWFRYLAIGVFPLAHTKYWARF